MSASRFSLRSAKSSVAIMALVAVMGLGGGFSGDTVITSAHAQLAPSASVGVQPSFADVVDRVKGSVVSIHVVGGGNPKGAQRPAPRAWSKGRPSRQTGRTLWRHPRST